MVKNSNFCRTFGHACCRNPFAKVDGTMPECAQVCALHMRPQSTALGDAKENRNGKRKPQDWYYVTDFLTYPIEPRDRWSKHMRHLDRGLPAALINTLSSTPISHQSLCHQRPSAQKSLSSGPRNLFLSSSFNLYIHSHGSNPVADTGGAGEPRPP